MGSKVTLNGECWENVHWQLYNVYDMSDWVLYHSGNAEAKTNGRRNPIAKWAEDGEPKLVFPAWHGMDRWMSRHTTICCKGLGRLGDIVDFKVAHQFHQNPCDVMLMPSLLIPSEPPEFESCVPGHVG